MKKIIGLALLFIGLFDGTIKAQNSDAEKVKAIVAQMTLEEKVHFLCGTGMGGGPANGAAVGSIQGSVPGAAGTTYAIPRLGIPAMVTVDGPAGIRIDPVRGKDSSKTYYATAFPVGTLLASSWDTSLVKEVGNAMGSEVKAYGADIQLAPGMNIQRNPLGGRNFEYYSEDPYVTGFMAAAMVNGVQSNGVGTSIKHFAGNEQETNRTGVSDIVSERALREIYLRGFEIAVKKSQPWSVMSSYNKINGVFTSERHDLLTDILRDEWHLNGFVMTDWFGGKNAVEQVKAGNDLLMPGTSKQYRDIMEAVKNGSLDVKIIDRNVERILNIVLKSPAYNKYAYTNEPDLKRDAEISRNAAAQGMVLLKDEQEALPLKARESVALFGNSSYDLIPGGSGSGEVNKKYTVSTDEGLVNGGFRIDKNLQEIYYDFINKAKAAQPLRRNLLIVPKPIGEMTLNWDAINKAAADNDIAMFTIGRNGGEGSDRRVGYDYHLKPLEISLLKNISEAFHAKNKKLIVVLNIDGPIEVASWRKYADGILLAWQPGLEGGNANADVLAGKVDPSGKLAVTFPMDYADVPSSKTFPNNTDDKNNGSFFSKGDTKAVYNEGIYVGYRYYDKFKVAPAYEFGYGLSYTNFKYSNLKLNSKTFNGSLSVSVTITNTGKINGKEVAELYLAAPVGNIDKPVKELKAFVKTELLKPGQSQVLVMKLNQKDLASFYTDKSEWIADKGRYIISVGSSSRNIKLKGSFKLLKALLVEKVHKALVPSETLNELK